MSGNNETVDSANKPSPWKRIAGKEVESKARDAQSSITRRDESTISLLLKRGAISLRNAISFIFLNLVHRASRAINKPVVDIGRDYSVSDLYSRINTLEEILVRQWSQLPDSEVLSPNEEVKLYVAACHVARQYDRISANLLSTRLGVSQNKAELLLEQLMGDEVITESYAVTYHDVRKAMVDATIERRLQDAQRIIKKDATEVSDSKKH